MKTIKLLGLLLITASFAFGQSFEGKIVYKNEYKSKIPNVTDDQFTAMMGPMQDFWIKGGNYKSAMNGTMLQWQVYIHKDNKLYNKLSSSPTALWNDGAVNPDEIIKTEINKGVIDILGYKCDELILTCKSGVQKYYFNPKIKVDAKLFEQHKFGNWSEVLAKTNSMPLKMVIDTPQFSVTSTATEVSPGKLEDKLFELPEGMQVQKSPY